jgi:hypothetical protein
MSHVQAGGLGLVEVEFYDFGGRPRLRFDLIAYILPTVPLLVISITANWAVVHPCSIQICVSFWARCVAAALLR